MFQTDIDDFDDDSRSMMSGPRVAPMMPMPRRPAFKITQGSAGNRGGGGRGRGGGQGGGGWRPQSLAGAGLLGGLGNIPNSPADKADFDFGNYDQVCRLV